MARKLSPGDMLRLRQIASVNPGQAAESWQALSEAHTQIAQRRTDRLGLTVAIYPEATGAVESAPPGFYAPAAAKIVLDGNLLPVEPDRLEIATDPDHFRAFAALHGVLVHECGHANHTGDDRDFSDEDDQVQMAITLLEEIRMEARVIEKNPDDARWLRSSARDIILRDGDLQGPEGAISSQILVLGRVEAGSLCPEDVADLEDEIRQLLGDDLFKKIAEINRETVRVADDDHDGLVRLGRRLAALFPEREGVAVSSELLEEIGEALDQAAGADGSGLGDLEDVLRDAEARGSIDQALAEIDLQTVGAASGSLPETGERYPNDDERRARNELFLKFRQVRWRDRHLVQRTSTLPPGRLNSRSALQRSAEIALGKMPSARPWKQKKRRQEEMPRLSLGVLIDTSGSMHSAGSDLSGSLWSLAHAAYDTGGRVAAALFGNGYELLWGPESSPPRHVVDIVPSGGTDNVPETIELLDEALGWDRDLGPRLLVIVSDGWWMQEEKSEEAIGEIRARGVRVIQVGVRMTPQDHGADEIVEIGQASDLARTVGDIAIRELRNY